jgi:L-ascorbate metabolism protein UlaG (beta-lactamase superfamily)
MIMKITYIRWSMTIIEMDGLAIVTDPVFRMLGFRAMPREYTIEQLPKPDLILVSHRHVDHWDPWTMRRLPKNIPLIVRPHRIADDARRLGYTQVQELDSWSKTQVGDVTIIAVPAKHQGTEVGFVLQGEKNIYFAGDTSFDEKTFTAVGQQFDLDVVLLPIGGLHFFGTSAHIDPPQAVEALKLLRPRIVIGIHWGCSPSWPPITDMPGTPQELAGLLAEAQMDVVVQGMAPLETVEI